MVSDAVVVDGNLGFVRQSTYQCSKRFSPASWRWWINLAIGSSQPQNASQAAEASSSTDNYIQPQGVTDTIAESLEERSSCAAPRRNDQHSPQASRKLWNPVRS